MPDKPITVPAGAVWMQHMNAWVDEDGTIYSGDTDTLGEIKSAQLYTPEDVRAAQSIFRSGRAQQFQTLLGQDPRSQMLGEYGQQYLASAMPGASAMYATSQMMPGTIGGQTYAAGLADRTPGGEAYQAPSFTQWATQGGLADAGRTGGAAGAPGYQRFAQADYQRRLSELSPFLVGGEGAAQGPRTGYMTDALGQATTADAQRAMRQKWGVGLGEGAGAMAARDIDFADAKALIMGAAGLGGVSPANPGAYYAARDMSRRIDAFKAANPEASGYQLLQDYTARGGNLGAGGGFTQFAGTPNQPVIV